MANYDIIYDSSKGKQKFQIASGYCATTKLLFAKENLVAVIEAKGTVAFLNPEGIPFAQGAVPPSTGGREVYEEVTCSVSDGVATLQFPIYEWVDNYPHCDGEHDRWDTRCIGFHAIHFDLEANNIL